MARFGTGINAQLGAIDYTPFLRGSVAGSEAMGRGIAALGSGIAEGIEGYKKRKEEEELEKNLGKVELNTLNTNISEASKEANKGLYANAPQVDKAKLDDLNRRVNSSDRAERKAAIVELATLNQGFKEAPIVALRNIQFESAQNALAQQKQERKNIEAMSNAISGLPTTISDTRTVERPVVTQREAMMNQNPELFPFAEGYTPPQLPQAKQPSSVVVTPPPGVAEFVFRDTPAKQYTFKSDVADAMLREQESIVKRNKERIAGINNELSSGSPPIIDPLSGLVYDAGGRPPTPSQRERLVGSLDAAQANLNAETERLNALKKRVDEAKKFEGTPLERPVDQQIVEQTSKAIAGGDNEEAQKISRMMSTNFKEEQRSYEETIQRPLTGAEKYKVALSTYLSEGGKITPDAIRQIETLTRDKVEIVKVGGLSAVRIGNNDNWQIVKPPTESIAGKKYDDEKEYYDLIGIAASGNGISSLTVQDRNRLSELYERFARPNPVTGLVPDLNSLIASRRGRVFGDSMDQNITPAPAPSQTTPPFKVKVKQP